MDVYLLGKSVCGYLVNIFYDVKKVGADQIILGSQYFGMSRLIDTIATKDDIIAFRNSILNEVSDVHYDILGELGSIYGDILKNRKLTFRRMLFFAITQTIAQVLILSQLI